MQAETIRTMGAVLAVGGALVMFGFAVALVYEAWALKSGRKPITVFVWEQVNRKPTAIFLIVHLLGWLFGHFFWR